jgi:hypothetical protein
MNNLAGFSTSAVADAAFDPCRIDRAVDISWIEDACGV